MPRFCSICLLAVGLACPITVSAEDPQHSAVTRVAEADSDFAYQGEYTGVVLWQNCRQPVGLQVVARGQGRFTGHLYPGGLPGNGYTGGTKQPLRGAREGDTLLLFGDQLQFRIQPGWAVSAMDSTGGLLGYLQPMKRYSPTEGAAPPAHARQLFVGRTPSQLINAKVSDDGYLMIGAETAEPVGDFLLHAEFKTPYMPTAEGQARGNSGFYIQRRYEVQVLDSFGLEPQFNDAAALYRFKTPDLNMSFPPLSWQTYDIQFTAARFDSAGQKLAKARVTVRHNGVVVQNSVELENKTGGGKPEGPELLPLLLQNHGNPVEYRNVWLVDTVPATTTNCPVVNSAAPQCPPAKWGRRFRR
jgi:hypothetical protein